MDQETSTTQPDQTQTPNATSLPERTAHFLSVLDRLLEYGQHLGETLRHRATAPGFAILARCFGTTQLHVILLHLYRGIMRANALRKVLLARAARGRDLPVPKVRYYTAGGADDPALQPPPEPNDPAAAPEQRAAQRPARKAAADEPLRDFSQIPTPEELEADAHRRPAGQVMIDICNDFGVIPGLCHARFWTHLWDVITWYGGNYPRYYRVIYARRDRFHDAHGRPLEPDDSDRGREGMRRVLGFFIGEEPVNPHAPLPHAPVPDAPESDAPEPAGLEPAVAAADRPP